MHAPFNLIKNISPRRPTRGTTNLALQFPSCPLDATSTLRDGAHSISLGLDVGDPLYQYNDYDLKAVDKEYFDGMGLLKLIGRHASG